jgi:hypothetical protein
MERSDSGEPRILKITQLIRESRFGIHDLSRIRARELQPQHPAVRFCLTPKAKSPVLRPQKRDFLSSILSGVKDLRDDPLVLLRAEVFLHVFGF